MMSDAVRDASGSPAGGTLSLAHGGAIPRLGFGTFRIPGRGPCRDAVLEALEAGYRHVDTAAMYRNEGDVGRAIRDSGLPRREIFVTTKLHNEDHGRAAARRALETSLERLGLDRVDLYLIHWPVREGRLESWEALEEALDDGLTSAIGVSNYMVPHLRELLERCRVPPAVNQIELHPFNFGSRGPVLDLCRELEIVVEAYSPLVKGRRLDDPVVAEIAREVERTPAQVLLRYALEKGTVVLPKSGHPERIRENAALFDFELGPDRVGRLDALDEGLAVAWDPTLAP